MRIVRVEADEVPLHPLQREILHAPARFKVISAGRRFGKTLLAIEWLLFHAGGAVTAPRRSVAIVAPSQKLLADIWTHLANTLVDITATCSRRDMRLELLNGSVIDGWILSDPNVGRGRRYHRLVIDEAAHSPYLRPAWQRALSPTLTDFRGEAWFVSTPNGRNYFYELYQRASTTKGWRAFTAPTSANPCISQDELAARREDLPPLVYAQEYEAQFVDLVGAIVKPEQLRELPAPAHLTRAVGVDLAISSRQEADYTAIVVAALDTRTGLLYLVETERGRWSFAESQRRIVAAAARHNAGLILIEDTQYQAAVVQELLRTTQLPVRGVRPHRDKLTRALPLLTRYERGLVAHDPAGVSPAYRDELLSFPHGAHDDFIDAAVYALEAAGSVSRLDTLSAPARRVETPQRMVEMPIRRQVPGVAAL